MAATALLVEKIIFLGPEDSLLGPSWSLGVMGDDYGVVPGGLCQLALLPLFLLQISGIVPMGITLLTLSGPFAAAHKFPGMDSLCSDEQLCLLLK